MSVVCHTIDLTPQQVATIASLTPIRDRVIEQWKSYGASRVTVRTYVRVGQGANKVEWLVQRNGRAIPNSTPGKGVIRG